MGGTKEKQVPARVESEPKVLKTTPVPSTTPESRHVNTVSEEGVDDDEADWKWEEEMIFKETDKPHQPDPIAKPLPGPEGYHDNIMLPPAWNATCIQSEFVTEENLVEFSRPVRETERFVSLQLDPAFWRSPVDSMIVKQQPEVRDKPITFKSVRLPGFPSLPPKPPTPENRDYRPMNSRKQATRTQATIPHHPTTEGPGKTLVQLTDTALKSQIYARRRADIATVRNIPAREKPSGQKQFEVSVPQSVASFASHGTEDSELSALEAELLGIAPKSKEGTEGKLGDHATKIRKRVQKVDSAYG
ncbi:hypothetical protein ColKHC_09064 [Colletotrichum higginsianum]|nr:hypothetical protein ColKHC_09064 [Colletotrichum higginsianum]